MGHTLGWTVEAQADLRALLVRMFTTMCLHHPGCPAADSPDRDAAHVVSSHPEQGWSLLCNGVVRFDDNGEILPDRSIIASRRPSTAHSAA